MGRRRCEELLEGHPGLILMAIGALFCFLTWVTVNPMLGDRATVGASWLPSAVIGVIVGVGLVSGAAAQLRARKGLSLTALELVLYLFILGSVKRETWAYPAARGVITTALENAELALCATMSLAVVAVIFGFYIATGRNRKMLRRSPRAPNGDLHMSRATAWRKSTENPITWEEWKEIAESAGLGIYDRHSPEAREDHINWAMWRNGTGRADAESWLSRVDEESARTREVSNRISAPPGVDEKIDKYPVAHLAPIAYTLARPDGSRMTFQWYEFQVTVVNRSPDLMSDLALIVPLAKSLSAIIYDESNKRL